MEVAAWSQAVPGKERLGLHGNCNLVGSMDRPVLGVA